MDTRDVPCRCANKDLSNIAETTDKFVNIKTKDIPKISSLPISYFEVFRTIVKSGHKAITGHTACLIKRVCKCLLLLIRTTV